MSSIDTEPGESEALASNDVNGIIESTDSQQKSEPESLLYRTDDNPPFLGGIAYSLQHAAVCVAGIATYPIIVMGILCADNSDVIIGYETALISTCVFVAGLSTVLQTVLGIRLPVFQGISYAYLVSMLAVLKDPQWKCPDRIHNTSMLSANGTSQIQSNQSYLRYYEDQDGVVRSSGDVFLRRLNLIQGAIIICSLTQMMLGITGVIGYLTRFIGPLTISPVLVMIAYGGVEICADLSAENWLVAVITVITYYVCVIFLKNVQCQIPYCSVNLRKRKGSCLKSNKIPIFASFPVIFAVLVGCIATAVWNAAKSDDMISSDNAGVARIAAIAPWLQLPYPLQFGMPTFTVACVAGMLSAVIPGILESVGDYNATALACDEPPPPKHAVNRGVFFEGVGILLAGLYGTANATTSWTTNIPIITFTRVASRRVFVFVGVVMMLLGVFPKSLFIFAAIPKAVMGGLVLAGNGIILAIGVSTLIHVDMMNIRNMFVFGLAVLTGIVSPISVTKYAEYIDTGNEQFDGVIIALLGNPIFVSGTIGFVLDIISPGTRQSRGLEGYYENASRTRRQRSLHVYELPFRSPWKRNSAIPICPSSDTNSQISDD